MKIKNKLIISIATAALISSSATASWYIEGKKIFDDYPLQLDDRSVDFGGPLSSIEAATDGVGVIIDGTGNEVINNSYYNSLVYQFGEEAKKEGLSLTEEIDKLNTDNPGTIDSEILNKNQLLKNDIIKSNYFSNGTSCNDNDPNTENDIYVNGICIGTPILKTSLTATNPGDSFIYDSLEYKVVQSPLDNSLWLDRNMGSSSVGSPGFYYNIVGNYYTTYTSLTHVTMPPSTGYYNPCPEGWKVPNLNDWENALGNVGDILFDPNNFLVLGNFGVNDSTYNTRYPDVERYPGSQTVIGGNIGFISETRGYPISFRYLKTSYEVQVRCKKM